MTALLDLPEIRRHAAKLSVEDYHRIGENLRAELLRGYVIEKMPKSPLHYWIVDRLRAILASRISPTFCLRQEGPLTLADSEPEPDLAIVRGTPDDYFDRHPTTAELVIEVAVTSVEIDRVKALIYAEAGIAEYWIVLPEAKSVEVHRQPASGGYTEQFTVTAPAAIESRALPGVRVELAALFA